MKSSTTSQLYPGVSLEYHGRDSKTESERSSPSLWISRSTMVTSLSPFLAPCNWKEATWQCWGPQESDWEEEVTMWTVRLAKRSPGQEILLQVTGTWWCIITWFSLQRFKVRGENPSFPLTFIPRFSWNFAVSCFYIWYRLRCGISCRANFILFTTWRWKRWLTSAQPLETPLATWKQTSQPRVTLSPKEFPKMILGHEIK